MTFLLQLVHIWQEVIADFKKNFKNKKEVSDMTMDKLNLANELVFKIKELNDFLREAKKSRSYLLIFKCD